jgi:hypothetical protein
MKTFRGTAEIQLFGNSDEISRVTKFHKKNGNSYNLSRRLKQSNSDLR